jgi:hypothetical protein
MKLNELYVDPRGTRLSLEQWKEKAKAWQKAHKYSDEKIIFTEPNTRGVIFAYIDVPNQPMKTINVGSYFSKTRGDIEAGTGIIHD